MICDGTNDNGGDGNGNGGGNGDWLQGGADGDDGSRILLALMMKLKARGATKIETHSHHDWWRWGVTRRESSNVGGVDDKGGVGIM